MRISDWSSDVCSSDLWATNAEGITGDALLDFINNQLFPKLKNLSLEGPERYRARVVRAAFEDAYNYMKNGTLIRQVVYKINEIDFKNTSEKHAFGDVYEQSSEEHRVRRDVVSTCTSRWGTI